MKEQIWRLGSILFGLFCVVGCLVRFWLNEYPYELIVSCILTAGVLIVTVLQNFGYTTKAISLAKYLCVLLYALEYFVVQVTVFDFELAVFGVLGMVAVVGAVCLVLEWNFFREGNLPEKPLRESAGQVAAVVCALSYLYPILFFRVLDLGLTAMGLAVLLVVDLVLFLFQRRMRRSRAMTVFKYVGNLAVLLFGLYVWCFMIFRDFNGNVVNGLIWLGMLLAVHLVCFFVELKFPFGEDRAAIKKTPSAISD